MANNDYVKAEGKAGRIGKQPMAAVCTQAARPDPAAAALRQRLEARREAVRRVQRTG